MQVLSVGIKIISASRYFFLTVSATMALLMQDHCGACTAGKETENSPVFLRLLTANVGVKKEQDYNRYPGKLENKTNTFRKTRITCGLVPCLPQN